VNSPPGQRRSEEDEEPTRPDVDPDTTHEVG